MKTVGRETKMADRKPTCGSKGETTDDIATGIFGVLGLGASAWGAIKGAMWAVESGSLWAGAVAGAVITLVTISYFYWDRCLRDSDGQDECAAGVVNEIEESFGSNSDFAFPFSANHDRVDLVIKCNYWHLVATPAQFVKCADDSIGSPILPCYYHSKEVCAAGLGSVIGGIAGAAGGILTGVAVAALIGCASVILCIVAILVAALVAVAITLLGANMGGHAAREIAGDSSPTSQNGSTISIGDYLTATGNLITNGESNGARVFWFVDSSTLSGRSTNRRPFSHIDPDANFPLDECPTPFGIVK